MALILAVNPGNRHSPTLARLARELPGCELIGAESYDVAIKAIKKRVPDILLLPATPARGESNLIAHLKSVPGGVLTLKLPAVEKADPVDLARQIREMLTGVPVIAPRAPASVNAPTPKPVDEPETSPHLLEAAAAAISWIRARRAQWAEPIEVQGLAEPDEPHEPRKPLEPDEPKLYEPIGPYEALDVSEEPDASREAGAKADGRFSSFAPRAAAAAVVLAVAAAAIMYWPRIVGSDLSLDSPNAASQAVETKQEPVVPQAATPEPPPAEPPTAASGWVAVTVPFEVRITEEGQPVGLDDQGRAILPSGRHRLRFQNSERGYDAIRTVQVRPAETTALTLTPETILGVTSNEPAEVLIDGTRAGETPYEGKVALGPHTVTVKTAGAERQLTVEATSKPMQLEVDFSKP